MQTYAFPQQQSVDEMRFPRTYAGNLNHRNFICPDRMNSTSGIHIVVARPKLFRVFMRRIRSKCYGHTSADYGYALIFRVRVWRHDELVINPEAHSK